MILASHVIADVSCDFAKSRGDLRGSRSRLSGSGRRSGRVEEEWRLEEAGR